MSINERSEDRVDPYPLRSTDTDRTGKTAPHRRLVFAIVSAALFMAAVDLTIVATALPAIHRSLDAEIGWVGWTITIYGLGTVVSLPIFGSWSNQFGRRRIFVLGVAVFAIASLLCGLSQSIFVLIFLRAIQAFGGGAIQPSAAGLIADHYGEDRGRAIGLFAVISSTGQLVGPIAGGFLVSFLSWRWIFFVNVPVGVIVLLFTLRYIPESSRRDSRPIDVVGLLQMSTGLLISILGVTLLGTGKTAMDTWIFVILEVVAFLVFVAFWRHSTRADAPLIPIRLLRGRGFARMNAINFLHGVLTFGVASLIPLYAENRYGLPPLQAGTLLTWRAVGMIALGTIAALALHKTGYRLPMILGFAILATGLLLISASPRMGLHPYLWLCICLGITGLGIGAVNPAASNACLHLEPNHVSTIIGLRMMFINFGVIVTVSITTAILNRSGNPGNSQAHLLWVAAALIFVVLIPLTFRVPESRIPRDVRSTVD